jgi:hypothetical protein
LLVDHLVDLLTADRRIEGFAILRLEPGHHRKRRFLLWLRGAGATVGAQLVHLAAKGNQFAVQLVKGAQTKITLRQQIGDGGVPSYTPLNRALISDV